MTIAERELLKVRGEKERLLRENTQLQHAKALIEDEMRTTVHEYEEKMGALQQRVSQVNRMKSRLIRWSNSNHSDNKRKKMD